jgi:peroxiredoxin Q/BCP
MGIKYRLLADVDRDVSKKFGVWGKKQFMGKEYMGVMRSSFLINKEGRIFKVYTKVKPAGHSKEVLDDFLKLN